MPEAKVRRRDITAAEAAAVIRGSLGDELKIEIVNDRELRIRKNPWVQARVSISEEEGGTVFHVRGAGGLASPLVIAVMRAVNDRGIAQRVVTAIGESKNFTDDA
jgi:hypothetical protein